MTDVVPIPLTAELSQSATEDEDLLQCSEILSSQNESEKPSLGSYVLFEKVTINNSQFLLEWPDMTSLTQTNLATPMTTFEVNDILEQISQCQTTSKTLIVDLWSLSRLAIIFDNSGTFFSDTKKSEAQHILQALTPFPLEELEELRGVLFSTTIMAEQGTFKHIDIKNLGHFVYFSFSVTTGELLIVDSLSNSFESSPYFESDTTKKFFKKMFSVFGGSERKFKPIKYLTNSFSQKRLECGYISLMNLILSLKYEGDLTEFRFSSYSKNIMNFKCFLCQLLITKNIPFNLVKTF